MKQKCNNEGLQSRRQFFKRAANRVLSFLGAALLSSMPLISNAAESCNCNGTCYGTCYGGCQVGCASCCYGNCGGTCEAACKN